MATPLFFMQVGQTLIADTEIKIFTIFHASLVALIVKNFALFPVALMYFIKQNPNLVYLLYVIGG